MRDHICALKTTACAKVAAIKPVIQRNAVHAEHLGFVAYATSEVFHANMFVYASSAWLAVTGIVVMILHDFRREPVPE